MGNARAALSTLRRRALNIRPENSEPYATHLPVLMSLARVTPVRRVLELGSGPFSTSLFLDRRAFPDLEDLTSYEDDAEWTKSVLSAVGDDDRLDYRVVDAVSKSVPPELGSFDLIFIDDSRTRAERSETIESVAGKGPRGLVVVHDFEHRQYRSRTRSFDNRLVFSSLTPQVGVCWNGTLLDPQSLKPARRMITENRHVSVSDRDAWLKLIHSNPTLT